MSIERFPRKTLPPLAFLYALCFVPAAYKLYERQCIVCAYTDTMPWYENWHTLTVFGFLGCYIIWKLKYVHANPSAPQQNAEGDVDDTNPLKHVTPLPTEETKS